MSDLPGLRSSVPRPGARPGGGTAIALGRLTGGKTPEPLRTNVPASQSSPLAPLDLGLDLDLSPDSFGNESEETDPSTAPTPVPYIDSPYGATVGGIGGTPNGAQFDPYAAGLMPDPLGDAGQSDLGFQLQIEDSDPAEEDAAGPVRPQSALPAIEVQNVNVLEDSVPLLSPHKMEEQAKEDPRPSRRRPPTKIMVGLAVLVLAGGAGAFFFLGEQAPPAVAPAEVLGQHRVPLANDVYPAYANGAKRLEKVAEQGGPSADGLRAAAAELLLLARIARQGPQALEDEAKKALSQIVETPAPSPTERRARALAALADNKPQRVPALLSGIASSVEGRWIKGLMHLQINEAAPAVVELEAAARANPSQVLGHYLLGMALEQAGENEKALAAYKQVLSTNADHLGAGLGAVRVGSTEPAVAWKAAEELLAKRLDYSSPAEQAAIHIFAGRNALDLGRTAAATRSFTQALVVDPANFEANIALGEAYLLREGKYEDALKRFQAAGPKIAKSSAGRFGLAGSLIANGEIETGLKSIEAAIKDYPKDPRGPFYKGWAAEKAGKANVLEENYRAALKLEPTFVPASLRLASALQQNGRAEDALAVLKAAEEGGAPPTVLQMAWGEALIMADQAGRAEEVFRKALASDRKLAPARMGLAAALEKQGRVGEAKMELEEMLAEEPNTDGLRERLAAMALRLGQKAEAIRHYEAEIEAGRGEPTIHVALGRVALDMGNLELARKHLEPVANDAPSTPGVLYTMGQLWEAEGDLGKALQDYRRATQFENNPQTQLAYGKALLKGGREDDALVALRNAEGLAEARLYHGRAMLKRREIDRAIADFTAAVALDAQMDEAYVLMGNAYDHIGNTEKAQDAWSRAIKIAPLNIEALYRLGRLDMDRGKPKQALDFLRKSANGVTADRIWAADVYFQLGMAEKSSGSKQNAHDALSKYLKLTPEDDSARPAVEKLLEQMR